MASSSLKSPFETPVKTGNLHKSSPSPMQISAKSDKALESSKDNELQNQKYQRSMTNLATILGLIEFEMQNEDEFEILEALTSQKQIIGQILHQKKTGQKTSFKKKIEANSQLQNLETKLNSKIDTLLQKVDNQSQNQPKPYAQVARRGLENAAQITQKQQQKQEQTLKYREKRLVIQVKKEACENLNSYKLRNQINDAFFEQENMTKPVIAAVAKSWTGYSIILTTMPDYNADFLLQKRPIWEHLFSKIAIKAEKDTHWSKMVIHGIPIEPFAMQDGLSGLREEIETYNPGIKLMKNPAWLSSEENRQIKKHASIVIALENATQAELAMQNKLCIAGLWLKAEKYISSTWQTQCQKCQKWGHSTKACKSQPKCQICAEKHATNLHKCNICNIQGKQCPHAVLKCANCHEKHTANSNICSYRKEQPKNLKSLQKNERKPVQTAEESLEQHLNTNSFAVLVNNADKIF